MKAPGGNFRWCEACGKARCQPPYTHCSRCQPRPRSRSTPRSPEANARRVVKQRLARRSAGLMAGFEAW